MPTRKPFIRQSRPDYSNGLYGNRTGLGPVPRRGWDEPTARLLAIAEQKGDAGIRHFYQTAALRLLKVLITIHPMAKMAHSNNASDICLPDSTKIVAFRTVTKVNEQTGETETSEEIDSDETQQLETFLNRYPGGLPGLQRALLFQLEWAGEYCLEAVPGKRGEGIARPVVFDPMSLLYYPREDGGWDLRQLVSSDWAATVGGGQSFGGNLAEIDLDPDTTFVLALDYEDDNPHGGPWFGAFLPEGLKDLGQERNLSDILKAWAYAHVSIGFDVDGTLERAKNNPDLLLRGEDEDDLTPEEYVEQEFSAFLEWLSTINPDDPLVMPKGTEAQVLESGAGLAALDPILEKRRHRMVMGLDQMPNRVGITTGGTQAYAKEQSEQGARKLEFARFIINAGPVWLCNLHLRLQGKELTARAETQPIRPTDRKMDAEAREIEVRTDYALVDRGAMDPEAVAVKHTGSGSYDPGRAYNRSTPTSSDRTNTDPPADEDDDEQDDDQNEDGNDRQESNR
jgi:hypothetical protein